MITEVVVRVLQWRRCLQVQRREGFHPGKARRVLLMHPDTAFAFGNIAGKEDHDCVQVATRQATHPIVRVVSARVPEDLSPSGHSLAEFFGKGSEGSLIDPELSQTVPGNCHRYPSSVRRSATHYRLAGPHLLDDAGQPGATFCRLPNGEEPVTSRHGPGPRQQKVLNVI